MKYLEFTTKSFPIPNVDLPLRPDARGEYAYNPEFDKICGLKNKLIGEWGSISAVFCIHLGHGIPHNRYRNDPALNSLYSYLKSCLYTDQLVNTKVKELSTENQELSSLIYGIWDEINELREHNKTLSDEINELKEHNKTLSERINVIENKPPTLLY